jgi:ABC-2 type transport system ATP-binding protein
VLSIAQTTMGQPRRRVGEVLDVVGLSEAEATRRLRDYSLGMRQRLGLAHALLGDPEVLILDEPANGLDPAGIRWMRDLLRGYADRGATVLLSSHLLHEIEVVADDLVVIGHGHVVAAGTKDDLLAGAGTHVATRDPGLLTQALTTAGLIHHADDTSGAAAGTSTPAVFRVEADAELVGHVAWTAGVALTELRPADGAGLEEMFLTLTADTQRDRHPAATWQGAVA